MDTTLRRPLLGRIRWTVAAGATAVLLALVGCSTPTTDEGSAVESAPVETAEPADPVESAESAEPADAQQEETCDWDTPKLMSDADAPAGQEGELPDVLVGEWQHTHTDEGAGFEEVTNDHRYVFPSPDRMLYCQHVPGATDFAENAADVTLNGQVIELPGGQYSYTVTAWDADTMLWDNPVGGGYVYLLQRR
ncbi:MAG: hypothetical protein ACTJGQ_04275 [Agrococcus casei]|uniref:hypothetical protein n=1 Tax=Agrococcus casei TaxID=343512 RepID=UPI003F8F1BB2